MSKPTADPTRRVDNECFAFAKVKHMSTSLTETNTAMPQRGTLQILYQRNNRVNVMFVDAPRDIDDAGVYVNLLVPLEDQLGIEVEIPSTAPMLAALADEAGVNLVNWEFIEPIIGPRRSQPS